MSGFYTSVAAARSDNDVWNRDHLQQNLDLGGHRMKRFFTLRQWKIFHLQIVKKFLPPDYEEVSRGHHFLEVPTPGKREI